MNSTVHSRSRRPQYFDLESVVNQRLHPARETTSTLWNFDWLGGRCSEVYKYLKNAVGLQKTARKCNRSGPSNRVLSEESHAVCHFGISGSDLVEHGLAPSLHCIALDGRTCRRGWRVLYTKWRCTILGRGELRGSTERAAQQERRPPGREGQPNARLNRSFALPEEPGMAD
jgi:hypothetical protein